MSIEAPKAISTEPPKQPASMEQMVDEVFVIAMTMDLKSRKISWLCLRLSQESFRKAKEKEASSYKSVTFIVLRVVSMTLGTFYLATMLKPKLVPAVSNYLARNNILTNGFLDGLHMGPHAYNFKLIGDKCGKLYETNHGFVKSVETIHDNYSAGLRTELSTDSEISRTLYGHQSEGAQKSEQSIQTLLSLIDRISQAMHTAKSSLAQSARAA